MFVTNGSYSSILTAQQSLTGKSEKEELIIVTFAVGALASLVKMIVGKTNVVKAMRMSGKAATNLAIYALSAAFAINSLVIMELTGVLLAMQNAGVMLTSVIFSVIFFKEKMTKMNIVGSIVMAIGLVGITLFQDTTFAGVPQKIAELIG
jgi:drug/metabolite transporter (DMT)-like permease